MIHIWLSLVLTACLSASALSLGITTLPPNTLVTGSGPIAKIPGSATKSLEESMVRSLFTEYCGADTERPLCNCDSGDQWNHPYFIAQCADYTGPTDCTCPNGAEFPVTFGVREANITQLTKKRGGPLTVKASVEEAGVQVDTQPEEYRGQVCLLLHKTNKEALQVT